MARYIELHEHHRSLNLEAGAGPVAQLHCTLQISCNHNSPKVKKLNPRWLRAGRPSGMYTLRIARHDCMIMVSLHIRQT